MTVRVGVSGIGRLERGIARRAAERRAVLGAAVLEAAETLRDEARRLLGETAASGESARPGAPPRRRSGALARSVTARRDAGSLAADAGSALDHARHLEFGTRRMAARPWLRPAFLAVKSALLARLRAAARAGLGR